MLFRPTTLAPLCMLAGLTAAAPAVMADPAPIAADHVTQQELTTDRAPAPTAPQAADAQASHSYAQREATQPAAQNFHGGSVVVVGISGGALLVILLILLLI